MTPTIWHNGTFKPSASPVLTAHDRLRLGEGVFNTILCINGKLQHADKHFAKLMRGCTLFWPDWQPPSTASLISAAHELLQHNSFTQGRHALNCTISGGAVSGTGLSAADQPEPTIIMRAAPLQTAHQAVHAIIAQTTRRNEFSPTATIKGSFYADHILALQEAKSKGGNEAILLNTAGNICCATVATLVMVKDGQFITPPLSDGPQDGITRSLLLQHYNAQERSITPQDLAASDGIYLLNSLRGAVTVASLDGQAIPAPAIPLDKDFHLEC